MNYKVNVPRTGMYKVSYRVASKVESGYLQLETAGGTPSYGTLQFPATGDWQNWTTVSHLVNLPAGEQTLAIKALSGGWNINWLQIEAVGGSSSSLSSSSSSSSSANSLTHIATVQAESYSYMSGVQIENTSDVGGGQNVGYIDAGDWMSYVNTPINLPSAGTYEIEFRVASKTNGANFNLEEAGGAPVYAAVNVGATGDWQNWTSVKLRVNLPAGQRKLGIKANNSGWNINWFKISKVN
jgi:endoglucanase